MATTYSVGATVTVAPSGAQATIVTVLGAVNNDGVQWYEVAYTSGVAGGVVPETALTLV